MKASLPASPVPGLHWLIWSTGIHIVLVALLYYMVMYTGFHSDSLLHEFSLANENNLAVWWSGFCLMVAGLLFYLLGSLPTTRTSDRIMWICLALVSLALSLDETGSLHERIDLLGGWWALLPFGLVGSLAFLFAIARCLIQPEYRISGCLILASLTLFVGVAGMEYFNTASALKTGFLYEHRLVVEEGMELFAISLMLLAGVIALSKRLKCRLLQVSIVVDPTKLIAVRETLYAGLIVHLCIAIFLMPYLWDLARGNPVYWFPMLTFTLAAFHSMRCYSQGEGTAWLAASVVLLLCSMGQLQNLGVLASKVVDLDSALSFKDLFARIAWTALPLVPFLFWRVPIAKLAPQLLLLVGVALMLHNGSDQFESYYIFSGVFSLMVFNLLVDSTASEKHPAMDLLPGIRSGA